MDISVRETGGVSVMDFTGNLDTNTSPAAESVVNQLLEGGSEKLIFNFMDLNYISSSGLRILLSTAKKMKTSGGKMMVCNLNDTVQEVFDISGFAAILDLASNEEEALAAF
jgi:anti-sigma B factor antagonist